jgi:hypothetical protein
MDCAYKFVTICIVDPSVRFTLDWVALNGNDTDELADVLRKPVSQVRGYVDINRVYLNRGFYRVHLALALEELGVEFVMRAPQTRKVQRFIADHDEDTFVAEYEMTRSEHSDGPDDNPARHGSTSLSRGRLLLFGDQPRCHS